jgi:hypothetical protein
MVDESDYWPQACKSVPDLRRALLERLATDLAVLSSPRELQRPSTQQCCRVRFEVPRPGTAFKVEKWTAYICGNLGRDCLHAHHRYDVFIA